LIADAIAAFENFTCPKMGAGPGRGQIKLS
jgi:hypothetical protein